MTYLTTAQTAELKGCSLQYVQKCVKDGKIDAEIKDNAANNRTEYMIPLTALVPGTMLMRTVGLFCTNTLRHPMSSRRNCTAFRSGRSAQRRTLSSI